MEVVKNVKDFLMKTYRYPCIGARIRKKARFVDGFEMSIQASEFHYCSPRMDDINGNYSEVELGMPSSVEEEIIPYAEDDNFTKTVYGYVPVEIVNHVIEKHGGIILD